MAPDNRLDDLTPREREVFGLLRLGLTNEEIAGRLAITEAGAKYHVSQILSRLGVATREEAAALAYDAAEAFQPRRCRWWAALPLAAKAAGVAVTVAAVAGLGLLAWGVVRTNGDADNETAFAPQTPAATSTVVPTSEVTPVPTPSPWLPPCLSQATPVPWQVLVEPDTVAVGEIVVVRGSGRYPVVLAPLYGLSPQRCPPESWPIPIPGASLTANESAQTVANWPEPSRIHLATSK